jgi:hypothetical protein
MNFDRIAGFASAGCILLVLTLNGWLGLWGPIWKAAWQMQPGDALAVIVAIIGWAVTILLGGGAILFSQRQISLAREQLRLQQGQIEEAQTEQRRAKYSGLDAEFNELTRGIDRLRTATAYLKYFAALFPTGQLDGWSLALYRARIQTGLSRSLRECGTCCTVRFVANLPARTHLQSTSWRNLPKRCW